MLPVGKETACPVKPCTNELPEPTAVSVVAPSAEVKLPSKANERTGPAREGEGVAVGVPMGLDCADAPPRTASARSATRAKECSDMVMGGDAEVSAG